MGLSCSETRSALQRLFSSPAIGPTQLQELEPFLQESSCDSSVKKGINDDLKNLLVDQSPTSHAHRLTTSGREYLVDHLQTPGNSFYTLKHSTMNLGYHSAEVGFGLIFSYISFEGLWSELRASRGFHSIEKDFAQLAAMPGVDQVQVGAILAKVKRKFSFWRPSVPYFIGAAVAVFLLVDVTVNAVLWQRPSLFARGLGAIDQTTLFHS